MHHPRLFLITPLELEPEGFMKELVSALSAGDVASLLIASGNKRNALSILENTDSLKSVIATAHQSDTSVIVQNDLQISKSTGADGVHIDSGSEELSLAVTDIHPDGIVGAGGVETRHLAMEFAELNADYVFFGDLDSEETPDPDPQCVDFAQWWAEVFEVPGVAMAGSDLDSIDRIGQTGIDFVAVRDAVWKHPKGAGKAVEKACEMLKSHRIKE